MGEWGAGLSSGQSPEGPEGRREDLGSHGGDLNRGEEA